MSTAEIVVSIILILLLIAAFSRLSSIARWLSGLRDEMIATREQIADNEIDIRGLEHRLDALLEHFGTSVEVYLRRRRASGAELVRAFLAENPGKLIQAIKLYRDSTGEGLKESKEVVESVATELGQAKESPVQPSSREPGDTA